MVEDDRCVIQVFEGANGLSLQNTRTVLTGHPMMVDLSPELLGRVLDGLGRPIDGLGDIYPAARRDVNGAPINPVSRVYPRNYIHTGISAIDCLTTLIRGQKLPIFSGSGMKHNELAVQIVRQASVSDGSDFAIVFAAMGVRTTWPSISAIPLSALTPWTASSCCSTSPTTRSSSVSSRRAPR